MYLGKKYLNTDHPNKKIKITMHFNKDTHHWATSSSKEKGYQITCTPVEVAELGNGIQSESSTAFSGFYEIVYAVERQSKKRCDKAWEMMLERIPTYKKYFESQGIKFLESED